MTIIEAAQACMMGYKVSRAEGLTTMEICKKCSCGDFLIDGENTDVRLSDLVAKDWEIVPEIPKETPCSS